MLVVSGYGIDKDKIRRKKYDENITFLEKFGSFAGVELHNVLSEKEHLGLRGEERFKALLDSEKVPFLYVGQGPFGVERSGVLLDDTRSKRPDFIAHIPSIGSMLFDVKCRQKVQLLGKGEVQFYLFTSEITALEKLQKTLQMPVWLAFVDRNNLENEPFYIASIASVAAFFAELKKEMRTLSNNRLTEVRKVKAVRIPNELLASTKKGIYFPNRMDTVSPETISNMAKNYMALSKKAEKAIAAFVGKENPDEKTLNSFMYQKLRGTLFLAEAKHVLGEMLRNGQLKVNKEGRYVLRKQ